MPYNIPISGLPGSLTLSDPPTSATGGIFDLWIAKAGDWDIVIPLSTDSSCAVEVLVELLQQQKDGEPPAVLAAKPFFITSTPTNYTMTVSKPGSLEEGVCNVTGLMIRLTPIERCCCPDAPDVLNAGDGSGGGGTSLTKINSTPPTWGSGLTSFGGIDNVQLLLVCGATGWRFNIELSCIIDPSANSCALSGSCSPLHLTGEIVACDSNTITGVYPVTITS